MSTIKYSFIAIFIFTGLSAYAQNEVFLKWKLAPGETISYKTILQEIDTANNKDLSFNGMGKMMGDSSVAQFKKIFSKINNEFQNGNLVTTLKENKQDNINIEMRSVPAKGKIEKDTAKSDSDFIKYQALLNQVTSGIMLRGVIHDDGTIKSFYTANSQKNLIAMFFELPGKPVKVGDSWPLEINYISTDQNFSCDSSFKKNQVTVTSIINKDSGTNVVLNYDVEEYIQGIVVSPFNQQPVATTMKFTFKGIAVFSLEKGRWLIFDGIISNTSTGMMSVSTVQKCSLLLE